MAEIEGLKKADNPTFLLKRFGQNCPLAPNEITWLLNNHVWNLTAQGEQIQTPYFDAKVARIDRIGGYANKVFLEAI